MMSMGWKKIAQSHYQIEYAVNTREKLRMIMLLGIFDSISPVFEDRTTFNGVYKAIL